MSETAKALADIISRKMTNSTALTAVVEVKVETSFVGLDQRGTGKLWRDIERIELQKYGAIKQEPGVLKP